jgi:L-fuconolactonase
MRVDAHHHVWDLAVRDQPWTTGLLEPLHRTFTLDELAPQAADQGIAASVLVQTVTVAEETPEFLALAAAHDLVAGVVGWVDLRAPDVADALEALDREWLVGIRHQVQGEPDPEWLLRPDVLRGLAAVAEAGLAYDLLTLPHQLPAAVECARRLPQLTFVLDHCSKPPVASGDVEPWASGVRALAKLPNVACKLSGLVTEADWGSWTVADLKPYADVVLDAFGPGRVAFGSDWPVCTVAASYAEVVAAAEELTAGLTEAERDEVFGGTARRVYRLT